MSDFRCVACEGAGGAEMAGGAYIECRLCKGTGERTELGRQGRADLLERIAALETQLAATRREHATMFANLTATQAVSSRLANEIRGLRRYVVAGEDGDDFYGAFVTIVGAGYAAECKHGPFFPRLDGIPDGTGGADARAFLPIAQDACSRAEERGGLTWRLLLEEEIAEVFAETEPVKLRAELAQAGAVCTAWIGALDRREQTSDAPSAPVHPADGVVSPRAPAARESGGSGFPPVESETGAPAAGGDLPDHVTQSEVIAFPKRVLDHVKINGVVVITDDDGNERGRLYAPTEPPPDDLESWRVAAIENCRAAVRAGADLASALRERDAARTKIAHIRNTIEGAISRFEQARDAMRRRHDGVWTDGAIRDDEIAKSLIELRNDIFPPHAEKAEGAP